MSHLLTRTPGIDWRYAADNILYASPFADVPRPEIVVCVYTDYDDSYATAWPTSRIAGGFSPMGLGGVLAQDSWDAYTREANWTGHKGWKTISGVTRDTNSAVLPSCQVLLFRTSDKLLMDEKTSDPNTGEYSVYTSDTGNHFVNWYKAGAPDRAGTSVNTLVGV